MTLIPPSNEPLPKSPQCEVDGCTALAGYPTFIYGTKHQLCICHRPLLLSLPRTPPSTVGAPMGGYGTPEERAEKMEADWDRMNPERVGEFK